MKIKKYRSNVTYSFIEWAGDEATIKEVAKEYSVFHSLVYDVKFNLEAAILDGVGYKPGQVIGIDHKSNAQIKPTFFVGAPEYIQCWEELTNE